MTNELLYYSNIPVLYSKNPVFETVPGIEQYRLLASYFDQNLFLLDRSGTLTVPFKVKNSNPLPEFDPEFNLTYRECSAQRMEELDKLHRQTGKKFRLLYSGGVDSSGIFAAFIDYYGLDKTKELLEICCSKESIDENPWLWDRFIRRENFNIISSYDHNHYWNDNKITLMGEGNDQLYGRTDYMRYKGNKNLYTDISVEELGGYLKVKNPNNPNINSVAELLIKVGEAAPIPITNTCLLIWWYNLALTWNGLMYRVLSLAKDLPSDILESGLVQFYNSKGFQQWSLKYHYDFPDSFTDIRNYKPHSKEMIIDILNLPEYASKGKMDSLPRIHHLRPGSKLIDTALNKSSADIDYLKYVQSNSFE